MIIPVTTLYEEFSEYGPDILWGEITTIQYFRPIDHGVENGFSTENLYIGKVSQLPAHPPASPCCYALIQDLPLPESYRRESRNTYLLLPGQHAYVDLFQIASDVFEGQVMVGLLSAELLQCVKRRAPPDEMVRQGYETLRAPLLLIDFSAAVLARAGDPRCPFSQAVLQALFTRHHQRRDNAGDVSAFYEMPWQDRYLLAGGIPQGALPVAYLIEEVPGPRIPDRARRLFQVLCNFLSLRMQDDVRYLPDLYAPGNTLLRELLTREKPDPAETARRAELLGIRLHPCLFVLSVEPQQLPGSDDQMRLFAWKLRQVLPLNHFLIEEGRVLALCDSTGSEPFSPTRRKRLDEFLADSGMLGVVSLPFSGLYDFPAACRQTAGGLGVVRRLKLPGSLVSYEMLLVPHLLLHYGEAFHLDAVVPGALRTLYQEDEARHQEFVRTLFAFVEHNCNMTQAAKALNIHYNTLKYRMQRITELTGFDPADPQLNLRLRLAKCIMQILGRL